ncbi:Glutamate dehydrogenase [Entamoeba marina]
MTTTPVDYQDWIKQNFASNAFIFKEEVADVIPNVLVRNKFFDNYLFLTFNTHAIVLSVDIVKSDERTLKHFKDKLILGYETVTSSGNLPGYKAPLKATYISFIDETSEVFDEKLQKSLIDRAMESDYVQCDIEKSKDKWDIKIAVVCGLRDIAINSCKFATSNFASAKSILVGNIVVEGKQLEDDNKSAAFFREFSTLREEGQKDQIRRELVDKKVISMSRGCILRALSTLAEQFLFEVNESVYNETTIKEAICYHANISQIIVDAFYKKFNPKTVDLKKYETSIAEAKHLIQNIDTGKLKNDQRRKSILSFFVTLVEHILKTNFFCSQRLAVGMRLNPKFLDMVPGFDRTSKFPEIPYEQSLPEIKNKQILKKTNMFGECYNLAYTQQKKNKDIPEGGSKGIIFLKPNTVGEEVEIIKQKLELEGKEEDLDELIKKYRKEAPLEYLYSMQRGFLHTLISLISSDEKGKLRNTEILDYVGEPEYVYIGPDENMHDCMIDWIAKESTRMQYHPKGAFISGKEETGINHKEYGVTSLGVFEFIKLGLEYLKLDKYTMKIKGGPNGDVAGNIIKLVHKYHKDRCNITSISSSICAIYDPNGINIDELLRMFENNLALQHFPPSLLKEGAYMIRLDQRLGEVQYNRQYKIYRMEKELKEEWMESNSAMRMFETTVHKDVVDVFCPCGGRPYSLNDSNVEDFFVDGKPTAKLVSEGANLYFTAKARRVLEESGVMIFKDSSANKCGVISSSYEILAGLSLDNQQFVEMKKAYAPQVLDRLTEVAVSEGKCMLDAFDKGFDKSMVKISEELSKRINIYTDTFNEFLKPRDLFSEENQKLLQIFKNYLPGALAQHEKQVLERVPQMHMKAIISTSLATRVVYQKGLMWEVTILDLLPNLL